MNGKVVLDSLENRLFRGKYAYFHSLRITTFTGFLAIPAVACLFFDSTRELAPILLGLSYGGDAIDGPMARNLDQKTKQGAILDPFMDKVRHTAVASSVLFRDGLSPLSLSYLPSLVMDWRSQAKRGNLLQHGSDSIFYSIWPEKAEEDVEVESKLRANNFGKLKTIIQSGVNMVYVSKEAYFDKELENMSLPVIDNVDTLVNYSLAGLVLYSTYLCYQGIKGRD